MPVGVTARTVTALRSRGAVRRPADEIGVSAGLTLQTTEGFGSGLPLASSALTRKVRRSPKLSTVSRGAIRIDAIWLPGPT